jgi:hypothetical protein
VKEGEGYVVAVAAVADVKEGAVVDDDVVVVVVGDDAKMDVAVAVAVAVAVVVVACNHLDQLVFDLLVSVR